MCTGLECIETMAEQAVGTTPKYIDLQLRRTLTDIGGCENPRAVAKSQ